MTVAYIYTNYLFYASASIRKVHIMEKSTSSTFCRVQPESRHGSSRVPGHAFLAWRSSWRMVVYIYYITAAGNSISSQLSSSLQGCRYGKAKAGGTAVHNIQNHTCRVTPIQPAWRVAVLGQPSSLWPHWLLNSLFKNINCLYSILYILQTFKIKL